MTLLIWRILCVSSGDRRKSRFLFIMAWRRAARGGGGFLLPFPLNEYAQSHWLTHNPAGFQLNALLSVCGWFLQTQDYSV